MYYYDEQLKKLNVIIEIIIIKENCYLNGISEKAANK